MKIAWFHGHMLHTNSGGTRFVVDYATGLKRLFNHEVSVFCDCASKEVVERLSAGQVSVIQTDHISTHRPLYWLTLFWRNARKRKHLRHHLESTFDCIISSLFPMNVLIADFDVPKVQMCYEPFAFFYDAEFLKTFTVPQQLFFKLMKMFYEKGDKVAAAKMDQILTVNKTNLPKIEAIYGRSAIPVYAGIDPRSHPRASSDEIAGIRAKHPGSPLLFHSTDLTGIKGTYPLLKTIKLLLPDFPNLKLLVTVYLDLPGGIARLRKRIMKTGLADHVEYLGCLPKEQLPLYYCAVDFVCQPSLNQPASWPLKEAMLCGTPIIGGAESEEVDGKNGVSINVADPEQSAIVLRNLFTRGRSWFSIDIEELKATYSIDVCLGQFNSVLESVCK